MASRRAGSILSAILQTPKPTPFIASSSRLRPYPRLPRTLQPSQTARRCAHSIPKPPRPAAPQASAGGNGNGSGDGNAATTPRKQLEPHYQLTFTCVPCGERSSHTISKQGYHKGSVLITCPSCRNRHIISDHLNIFGERKITVEDLMREKGQLVKRGTLGEDGDIEFWEDETATPPAEKGAATDGRQEASALRDARDPSAQAAQPATATPSPSPLNTGGARPHVDTPSPTGAAPSTRRQFHTSMRRPDDERMSFRELQELRGDLKQTVKAESKRPRTHSLTADKRGPKIHYHYSQKGYAPRTMPPTADAITTTGDAAAAAAAAPTNPKHPRKGVVYTWPGNATKAVPVYQDAGNASKQQQVRRVVTGPETAPSADKRERGPRVADMEFISQRPLPEQIHESIMKGMESASGLAPQRVQLDAETARP
ncbi:hypothetical protein JX265_006317 [Neoarthrinium moseri]|uniref:DNL-type domain-containing protein n=1 Tax=Neoarthrinium moseri TaxID=1658444 RepID=A0A9P9WLU7_9PEZI|nr:hypothetical protein JX265_006317 [Neoarthrinium moseri]